MKLFILISVKGLESITCFYVVIIVSVPRFKQKQRRGRPELRTQWPQMSKE